MPLGELRLPPRVQSLLREPYASESKYFSSNPEVAGMAAEDNRIILNPYSKLAPEEKAAVAQNEAARIYMRQSKERPTFELTPEQDEAFADYGSDQDKRETIIGRIISGDPSAGRATKEQVEYAIKLLKIMNSKDF